MNDACPFCAVLPDGILLENDRALAFRDRYPVSAGHTLVIPRRHVVSAFDLDPVERDALWRLVADVRTMLQAELAPDGFTVGINDGVAAGQTVLHAHVHVIPRRTDDVPDPRGGIRWVIPGEASYWVTG